VGLDETPRAEAGATGVAVVYDHAADLVFLRSLMEVPEWEVRFFRGDDEAIDFFRQSQVAPPAALLLDYADANPDRVEFFALMVRECAPAAKILVICGPGGADERLARIPAIAAVVPRPLVAANMIEQVRALLAGAPAAEGARADVVVRFGDTGAGIPPDVMERIFDPFFTTKETRGTGLGLSVVHKILDNHGASIGVDSVPGRGTTFTMVFPQSPGGGPGLPFRIEMNMNSGRTIS